MYVYTSVDFVGGFTDSLKVNELWGKEEAGLIGSCFRFIRSGVCFYYPLHDIGQIIFVLLFPLLHILLPS